MQTSPTVLLIEDEPIIRLGTVAMLEDAGYLVLEASNAQEGLDILSSHPEISAVVTDVQMPGEIDGLSLVSFIREKYPNTRSIVTSGLVGLSEAQKCGANNFVSKPYTARSIETALRSLLAD